MNKVTRKKRTTTRQSVTAISLQHINEKLEHIHKDLEQNSKDISQLKQQMAMGKGGLKVIFYVGGIVSIILGVLKIGKII